MLEIRKEDGLFTIKFFEKDISSDLLRELLRNSEKISEKKSRKYHRATMHLLEIAKQSTASSKGQRWTRDDLYE